MSWWNKVNRKDVTMNLDYLFEQSLVVQIHALAAIAAFFLGAAVFLSRKGTPAHKLAGRVFGVLMIAAATSAIFIREINDGSFSFIHIFVPITFIGLYQIISTVRRGDISSHRKHVRNMFFGALLIPGFFAFMPGRVMWVMFFGG
jgi:uncharacterized membrane protein